MPNTACSTSSLSVTGGIQHEIRASVASETTARQPFSRRVCQSELQSFATSSVVPSSTLFQHHSTRNAKASPLKKLQSDFNHEKCILQRMGTMAEAGICKSPCADPIFLSHANRSRFSAVASLSRYVSAASNSHTRTGSYTSIRLSQRRSGKSKS